MAIGEWGGGGWLGGVAATDVWRAGRRLRARRESLPGGRRWLHAVARAMDDRVRPAGAGPAGGPADAPGVAGKRWRGGRCAGRGARRGRAGPPDTGGD